MEELVPQFKKALFGQIIEVSQDFIEIGIDSIMNDEILKQIPILKTIISGGKIIATIQERNLMKNIYIFVKTLNDGSIDEEKKKKYQNKINNNSKLAEKELGRILILLNQYIDNEKSIILSKLFKSYINEILSWEEFCEYSEIVNRMFVQDISILEKIRNHNIDLTLNRADEFRVERLYSLGLIGMCFKPLTIGDMNKGTVNNVRTISALGIKFCDCIFEK